MSDHQRYEICLQITDSQTRSVTTVHFPPGSIVTTQHIPVEKKRHPDERDDNNNNNKKKPVVVDDDFINPACTKSGCDNITEISTVVKDGVNKGRHFYRCSDHGFSRWVDEK